MGNEFLPRLFVKIFQRTAGTFLMAAQVIIRPVGDALQFLDAEGEFILQVIGFLGVESAFAVRHVQNMNVFARNPHFVIEAKTVFQPFIHQAQPVFRPAEIFDFHLFEFAGTESEVPRVDLIAERFSDLGDSERQFDAGTVQNVLILAENGLGRFRAQPARSVGIVFIRGSSNGRLEHEVELTGFRQQRTVSRIVHGGIRYGFHALAFQLHILVRGILAGQLGIILSRGLTGLVRLFFRFHQNGVLLFNIPGTVFFGGPGIEKPHAALGRDLVRTQTLLGQQAIAHRVGESAHMAGSHQYGVMRQDGTVHADHILAFLHIFTPPVFFQIALELHPHGTIVPATVQTAVNFS